MTKTQFLCKFSQIFVEPFKSLRDEPNRIKTLFTGPFILQTLKNLLHLENSSSGVEPQNTPEEDFGGIFMGYPETTEPEDPSVNPCPSGITASGLTGPSNTVKQEPLSASALHRTQVGYSQCAPMYGKCRLLSIDR